MSTPGSGGPQVAVGFVLDPAASRRLVTEITGAFTTAMNAASTAFAKQMADIGRSTAANIRILDEAVRKLNGSFGQAQAASHGFTTQTSKETIEVIRLLKQQNATQLEIAASLNKSSAIERQLHIASTSLANTEGRVRVEQIRNVGRVQFVEGQKNLIQVRENAKRRLLLNQQLFQHLVRLEKTLGTGIAGAARGLSAGFSKVFISVRGLFTKNNEEITSGFRKNGQAVERGLKQGNTAFNNGLSESLNKRERALRTSFTEQEHIVRRSVLRQEEQLTKLRTQTSHGVLGAVTGRGVGGGLGLGSLFGGLGVIGAIASTFTIGGEFTKGLAVLQTQLNLTGEQMKGVRKLSIDLGNDITLPGVSALDAAQAIQTLTKTFGYLGPAAVDAAEKAAKGTLQLSRATGSSAEESAAIIGAAVNVFKIGADQAVSVADSVAVAISKAAGVSFSDFKDSFTQGATIFEQFVGPAEDAKHVISEFSTALAVLARSGITGETAGAGLKQFFIQGNKEGKKANVITAEIVKRAGTTGKIFFDAAGHSRKFADSIDILRKGLVGMTDAQRASTLSTLFGSRSLTIANALVNTSAAEFDALEGSMNRQGAAAAIAAAANTGLKGAFDALKSVIETVQIVFYEKVQKPLGQAVLWFAALANEILFSNGAWHFFRRAVLGAVAAISAVIALKGAIEVIKLLGTALTALTTPFGAILLVAGLVGAAIALMTDNTSKLGKALNDLATPLVEGFGKLIGAKPKPGEVAPGTEGHPAGLKQAATLSDVFTRLKFILTKDVIPALREAVAWVGEHLVRAFKIAYHFIADTVVPLVAHFAKIVIRDLIGAFHATVRFVQNVLIPGFKTVYHYIAETLIPKIVHIAGVIADAFVVAGHAVADFWRMVKPYLDPLINGFSALGKGVGAIFTGDFSHVGAGFVAAGEGIAGTVAKTARSIGDALHPIVNRIGQFFTDLFSPANIKLYIKGALNFVNTLGYVLGRIVSDPRLVKTIAIIGAVLVTAAIKIAFEFITGFFRGVIENLPKLFAMAGSALEAGFKLVFSNIGKVLVVALGLLALGPTLARLFRGAGVSAGDGFLAGLKTKAGNAKGFLGGFFGSAGGLGSANLRAGHVSEISGLNNQSRILGGRSPFLDLTSSTRQIENMKAEIEKLRGPLTDAQLHGLKVRDAFRQAGVAAKGIGSGLGGAAVGAAKFFTGPLINGIKASLNATNAYTGPATSGAKAFGGAFKASLAAGAGQFKAGLQGAFGAVQEFAKSQGITTGQAFGHALGKAAVAAAAIAGGFVAGKAEGAAGGSGILTALLGGVTTGAVIGGGFGAAVGVLTAGAGLIGAAFGRAGQKAKEFKEFVKGLADSFGSSFTQAIKDGVLTLDDLKKGLSIGDVLNVDGITRASVDALANSLSTDQVKLVGDLGLNLQDVLKLMSDNKGDVEKFGAAFQKVFETNAVNSKEFATRFGADSAEIGNILLDILKKNGPKDIAGFLNENGKALGGFLTDAQKHHNQIIDLVDANRKFLDANLSTVGKIFTDAVGISQAITDAENKVKISQITPADTTTGNFQRPSQVLAGQTPAIKAVTEEWKKLILKGLSIDEANAALHLDLPPIPPAQLIAWRHDLDGLAKEIEGLQSQLDAFPDLWAAAIAASVGATPAAVTQANAVVAVASSAPGLTVDTKGSTIGQANLDLSTQGVAKNFTDLLSEGVKNGTILTPADAQKALEPLQRAAIEAINASVDLSTPEGRAAADRGAKKVNEIFLATVVSLPVQIDELKALADAAALDQKVTDYLNLHPGTFRVDATFQVVNAPRRERLEGHGLPFDILQPAAEVVTPQSLGLPTAATFKSEGEAAHAAFVHGLTIGGGTDKGHGRQGITPDVFVPAASDFKGHGKVTGDALVAGIADAIHSKASKGVVTAALTDLSGHTVNTARGLFKISSPSKVFHGIGMFLSEGLANGITSGAQQVASNAAIMAQGAINAAQGVLDGGLTPPTIPPGNAIPPGSIPSVALPRVPGGPQNLTTVPPTGEQNIQWAKDRARVVAETQEAERAKVVENVRRTFAMINAGRAGSQVAGAGFRNNGVDSVAVGREIGAALAKRGPDVTNVTINEAVSARATGRAAITELRAERLLQHGLR